MNVIDLLDSRFARVVCADPGDTPLDRVRRALSKTYSHALGDTDRLRKLVEATRGDRPLRKLHDVAKTVVSTANIRAMVEDRAQCAALGVSEPERTALLKGKPGRKTYQKMSGVRFVEQSVAVVDEARTLVAAPIEPDTPADKRPDWFEHRRPGEYRASELLTTLMRDGVERPSVVLIGGKTTIEPEGIRLSVPGELWLNSGADTIRVDQTVVARIDRVFAGIEPDVASKLVRFADARARNIEHAERIEAEMLKLCPDAGRLQSLVDLALDPEDRLLRLVLRKDEEEPADDV